LPSEVNSEHVRLWKQWKITAREWLAVIIASVATLVSIIAMFVTAICIGIIFAQSGRIEELSDKIGVLTVRIENHEHKEKHDE